MVKEAKIIEPREGIDFHTAHVYNNTDQRLILSLERRTERDTFIYIGGAVSQLGVAPERNKGEV